MLLLPPRLVNVPRDAGDYGFEVILMAKRGRPKKQIDYELVKKLAGIMCTQEEIANILDISTRTLQRDSKFCRIYKTARENGKMSLRRMQFKKAMEGNVTMLIWLGKQYLGQKEQQKIEHELENGKKPQIKIELVDAEQVEDGKES